MTKEQIEMLRAGLLESEWCGYSKRGTVNALCDLALSALSLESVRSEADLGSVVSARNETLEEAAKVCDLFAQGASTYKDQSASLCGQELAERIRALQRSHASEDVHSTELRK